MNNRIDKFSSKMVGIPPSGIRKFFELCIGHDDIIGDYCHISSHACVGSFLNIGRGVHVGLNATVREHLNIGDFATVGMGAVLTKNVGAGEIWVGNPARFLRMVK